MHTSIIRPTVAYGLEVWTTISIGQKKNLESLKKKYGERYADQFVIQGQTNGEKNSIGFSTCYNVNGLRMQVVGTYYEKKKPPKEHCRKGRPLETQTKEEVARKQSKKL